MKNSIFEYDDYRVFLKDWVKSQPNRGRGQMGLIAQHLNTSSVSVSYIFNGSRNLSEEQTVELAEFLGLSESESNFLLCLVQLARAGSHKLEKKIRDRIAQLRSEAQKVKERVPQHRELGDRENEKFHSYWYYSAIWLLTSIDGHQDIASLAQATGLSRARVREVVDFLLECGLCVGRDGSLRMGPQRTHVDAKSPHVGRHHGNWRLKAIEGLDTVHDDELFFTGPMTISEKTFQDIRRELVDLIARITKMVEPSKSEQLACVNFDLFRVIR